jgi:hypothetical protein
MVRRLLILALVLSSTSCATRKYMMSQPLDNGLKAVYDAPFDKVKRACYDVIAELSYGVKDEMWDHRDDKAWVINSSTVYVLVESKAATRGVNQADQDDQKSFQARIEKRVTGK